MDQVFVVVVKDSSSAANLPELWTGEDVDLPSPKMGVASRRKYQIAVWRAVQRNSKRCLNRDTLLGMVAVLGISVASWTGVAVLISHLVR